MYTDGRLCKIPETVEQVFINCWDAVFHCDLLKSTLKKELPISPQGIRYWPVVNDGEIPCDIIIFISLYTM